MTLPGGLPRLHHARSSYYSMIARLALVEGGVEFESKLLDIHRRSQQFSPEYARLNPHMTVPTLELGPARILDQSRDIVLFALTKGTPTDEATTAWLDRQYAFPIEELTFGRFLTKNPLARRFVPKALAKNEAKLSALAKDHPDLESVYVARAEVFAARVRAFAPDEAMALFATRRTEAIAHLDALEQALADGRGVLVPPDYGPADVVWTVFLARLGWVDLGGEVERRPALSRYWNAMRARPSFRAGDVWTKLHPLKMLRGFF